MRTTFINSAPRHTLVLLFAVLLVACTKSMKPFGEMEYEASCETRSSLQEYYYWYNGEQLPLIINKDFINVLVDTAIVKLADVPSLCTEFGLEAKTKPDKDGLFKAKLNKTEDYYRIVDLLRNNHRIRKILPFFERGQGLEPIGTSHLFYVQLMEVVPNDQKGMMDAPVIEKKCNVDSLEEDAKKYGISILNVVDHMPDWYVLSIEGSDFKTAVDAANTLFMTGHYEATDPAFMFRFRPNTVNDPLFSQQWGLKNTANPGYDINVEGAWTITTGIGSKIAIVDQCPDPNHIDLVSNYYGISYDAESQSVPSVYDSDLYHGTHVAGIAAAKGNNSIQIAGVAYDSKLIRVSHSLYVTSSTISAELASGISWAWQIGADVINNSWGDQGGEYYNDLHSQILESAIINAMIYGRSGKGSVVVFAAGNYGYNGAIMDYPATFDDRILTVGSMGPYGYRSSFSGYGPKLDVVAPGEGIISTTPGNSVTPMNGTSMAAPHVSGLVALMLSTNTNLKREEVVRFIEQTAKKISPGGVYSYYLYPNRYNGTMNQEVGYGLVDATAAVTVAHDASIPPSSGSPSLDYYAMYGIDAQYDTWCVMQNSTTADVYFSLRPPQINTAYTYYWHFSTSGDSGWQPSFNYVGNNTYVEMMIPKPAIDSILTVRCEIYNGTSHICTACLPLTILINYP